MNRVIAGLLVATLLCVLALPAYSISSAVSRCTTVAQQILDNADPLDRAPPPRVVAAIKKWIGVDKLSVVLATVLLGRFRCNGENADWLIGKPVLTWRLERRFDHRVLISLFTASADMSRGITGFNAGAKRYFSKNLDELNDWEITQLVQCATAAPGRDEPPKYGYPGRPPPWPGPSCPSDFHAPSMP